MNTCTYCGGDIHDQVDYRRVAGWERIQRPPSATKAFHAPEKLESFACFSCVMKLQRGVAPTQVSLM